MIPVLFATTMAIPVSRNGTVNSAAACRWAFTFKAERAISVRLEASSRMRPFQRPFWGGNKFSRNINLHCLIATFIF